MAQVEQVQRAIAHHQQQPQPSHLAMEAVAVVVVHRQLRQQAVLVQAA
jgi:hypothetical protein